MRIFYRLLSTYIAVVLAVLLVLALVLSRSLAAFVFQQEEQRLLALSITIDESLAAWQKGQISTLEVQRSLSAIDQALNTRVWVVDNSGRSIFDSRMRMGHGRALTISPQLVQQSLRTKVSVLAQVEDMDAQVVLLGIPSENTGAIILLAPVTNVQGTLNSIYRLFWPAAGLSFIAAALLALLVSRGISHPLSQMSAATSRLAGGDFSQQVKPAGDYELRQLAESFNFMAGQLHLLETMRRDLIASVSHELRTPLTSILGFVQAVRDEKIPPARRQDYLDRTLAEIRRLNGLVRDLLDLSALEGKAAPLNLAEIDLVEVVNLSIAALEPQLVAHGTEPILYLPPGARLQGDQARLQQLVMNLADNTLKHTPPETTLTISLMDQGDTWELKIRDTGPGISREQLTQIFKPFFRCREGGTGLGLAIAKALAEAHGGTLTARIPDPGGLEFNLNLPKS